MSDVRVRFPPGHFYSPIVNPVDVTGYIKREREPRRTVLPGLDMSLTKMTEFWQEHLPFIESTPFLSSADGSNRYYYGNQSFGQGDAIILRAIMNARKPKQIIEIGSGFSTACMLDTLDHVEAYDTRLTCIEPYPDRLQRLLRPKDAERLEICEDIVQNVSLDRFTALMPNDILFVDSTHVLKTGSDVHYEIFNILPCLQTGVIIHFHDIQYPFEYPDAWIFNENFSWNEIYALRAFLMYNSHFEIFFFNNFFGRFRNELISRSFPGLAAFPESFGGSIWLRKCG